MNKQKNNRECKKWIIACSAIIIVLIGATGYYFFDQHQRETAYQKTIDSLSMKIDMNMTSAEYGSVYDISKLVLDHTGTITSEGSIDTKTVGVQTMAYKLQDTDSYGKEVNKKYVYTVLVKDTQAPVIAFKEDSLTVTKGDDFDPLSNIASVKDPVDGDLPKADALAKNAYTVSSDVDMNTEGEYTVSIKAMDKNGLETDSSYNVTVKKTEQKAAAASKNVSSSLPYLIMINRAANTVTVYTKDADGNYTVPYTAFVCSTGTATPLGTYRLSYKYRWRALFGNVYGQYATVITGNILFHSVPYYAEGLDQLESEEYNKLGTAASMGCIRMCVRDAKWIYDNCASGTSVVFYDDADNPGPLGKPSSITLDLNDARKGWDPTDPDPSNPWNS
jgi:lipoprotein-anchoring transpeptidase ErfK/SrfK